MQGVALALSGQLGIQRTSDGCSPTSDPSLVFRLGLLAANASFVGGSEISQKLMTINSASFVAMAVPSSLRARVVYLRPTAGTITGVSLTHATAGLIEYPVAGTFLIELPAAEQASTMGVRGVGSFEWMFAGVLV